MIQAKEVTHPYYEQQRSLSEEHPLHQELDETMKEIHDKAYQLSELRNNNPSATDKTSR